MMMLKEIRSEKVNIQPKAKPMHCKEHQNAKLVFYSEKCEELMYNHCTKK